MTLEAYMRFSAKLSEAKDEMGTKEYEEFTRTKKINKCKTYVRRFERNIDYDRLLPAKNEKRW